MNCKSSLIMLDRFRKLNVHFFHVLFYITFMALTFAMGCSDGASISQNAKKSCDGLTSCSACGAPCAEFFNEGRLLSRMTDPSGDHALWLFGPHDGTGDRVTSLRLTAFDGEPGVGQETVFIFDEKGEKILLAYGVVDNIPMPEMLAFEYHVGGEVIVSSLRRDAGTGEILVLQREVAYPSLIDMGVVGGLSLNDAGITAVKAAAALATEVVIVTGFVVAGHAIFGTAGAIVGALLVVDLFLNQVNASEIEASTPIALNENVQEDQKPFDLPEVEGMIVCASPVPPVFGTARLSGVQPGNEVIFSCANGYTLIGNQSTICGENGLWGASPPLCVPDDCPRHSPLLHGRVDGTFGGGIRSPMLKGGSTITLSGTFNFTLTLRPDEPISDITNALVSVVSSEDIAMTFSLSGVVTCGRIYGRFTSTLYGVPFEAEMGGSWLPDGNNAQGRWWGKDLQSGDLGQGMGSWSGTRIVNP